MMLLVRDFEAVDAASAADITNIYIRETHIHFAAEPLSAEEFVADWRALQPRFPWVSATWEGQFAGYAKAAPWRQRHAYRFTAETAVYIHPSFQRRGIARGLMLELLERLGAKGFRVVIAGIALPNPASIALHEKMGFSPVGTFPGVGIKFGCAWDVGFWQRSLP
jgi:L-amino acid N-acyltransferase YncA